MRGGPVTTELRALLVLVGLIAALTGCRKEKQEPALTKPVAAKVTGWQHAKWGMTPSQVKEAYPDVSCKEGELSCTLASFDVAGATAQIVFAFADDRLASVIVAFRAVPGGVLGLLSHFDDLVSRLADKYGPPDGNKERLWKNRPDKPNPEKWADELVDGNLSFWTDWASLEEGTINLTLGTYEQALTVVLIYQSKEYGPRLKELERAARISDL
jgi:hypothetical protein